MAVADKGAMMFQYYIKIVPTTYAKVDGSLFLTSQVCSVAWLLYYNYYHKVHDNNYLRKFDKDNCYGIIINYYWSIIYNKWNNNIRI